MLSGGFNRSSLSESEALIDAVFSSWFEGQIRTVSTEYTHVFADSTNAGITDNSEAQ
ncbi:hypothetical protein BT96DRAFT_924738 [Gymnopus androsaceus JB14]|uniref:Uncharacterized protein n=1 Tax=Gymnopus androsaceus JB14 TaxID=1447944 RepID=A0A6A4H3V7_9AGAR|nr:hypothetical protein BT96DRAFT_924738 [Gymnopus androsaceus JB14]